jgi:prepilin-type N-terminal cleavage/methylation domain-containing protein/prepilin-type processing-associated H-X9-DG protein
MQYGNRRRAAGFTLIELLVVIAVIGVLIGLLLPAIQSTRESARNMQCQNNLKQLGLAFHGYATALGGLPPRRHTTTPYQGWGPYLLAYLEQAGIAKNYDTKQDFFAPDNQPFICMPVESYICPSAEWGRKIEVIDLKNNPTGAIGAAGDYFAPNSVDAFWWPDPAKANAANTAECPAMRDNGVRPLKQISDGLSRTLLVAELAGRPSWWVHRMKQDDNSGLQYPNWWGPWASYNSSICKTWSDDGFTPGGFCTINCNNAWGIYGFHPHGANALFVDGAVHHLAVGLDREIFAAIVTRAGRETFDSTSI